MKDDHKPCIAMMHLWAVAIGAALRVERRTGVIRVFQDGAVDRSLGPTRAVGASLHVPVRVRRFRYWPMFAPISN
ncbi:hypothetical protein EMIT0P253_10344 [Pseudomonas sp. IT-P253]